MTDQNEPKKLDSTSQHQHKHAWLEKHFWGHGIKKLGFLGIVIFVLHILFHIVELLILPAILVWLGLSN